VWLDRLTSAARCEMAFRLDEAESLLDEAKPGAEAWRAIARLLRFRILVRRAEPAVLNRLAPQIRALAGRSLTPETAARAWHLLGVLCLRLNRLEEAEEVLVRALRLIEEGPAQTWVMDSFAQALVGQGAWEEGRRTIRAVIERKLRARDHVGVAISTGYLARLELMLGRPLHAAALLRRVLGRLPRGIPVLTRLRLQTFLVEACLGAELPVSAEHRRLSVLLRKSESHYLKGYALLALARVSAARSRRSLARRELHEARRYFRLPDQLCLLRYSEARLDPGSLHKSGIPRRLQRLFDSAGIVTEGEVMIRLLMAERAGAGGDRAGMRAHLEAAARRASAANNPLWIERVDAAFRRLDPERLASHLIRRFSGRSLEQLERTVKDRVTIIFADLVGFTPRSQDLTPEDVMQTVRSLFELSVPLLGRHRVRPLSYLGDGLLALCEGPGHERRGLAFALDVVRKAARVTLLRETLGDRWGLTLRAGVASGPVVQGVLGSLFKLEYAAIGMTVNLASRLQGAANPSEVVCAESTARAAGVAGGRERLRLKGLLKPVSAVRLRVEG